MVLQQSFMQHTAWNTGSSDVFWQHCNPATFWFGRSPSLCTALTLWMWPQARPPTSAASSPWKCHMLQQEMCKPSCLECTSTKVKRSCWSLSSLSLILQGYCAQTKVPMFFYSLLSCYVHVEGRLNVSALTNHLSVGEMRATAERTCVPYWNVPFKQTSPSTESISRLFTACYCHISQFLILSNWVMTATLLADTSTARSVQSVAGFTLRYQVCPTWPAALATGAILKSNKSNSGKQTCALMVVLVVARSCREFMMHSCAPRELWNQWCSVRRWVRVLTEATWCISAQTIPLAAAALYVPVQRIIRMYLFSAFNLQIPTGHSANGGNLL